MSGAALAFLIGSWASVLGLTVILLGLWVSRRAPPVATTPDGRRPAP